MTSACDRAAPVEVSAGALTTAGITAAPDLRLAPGEAVGSLAHPYFAVGSGAGVHLLVSVASLPTPVRIRYASDDLRPLDSSVQAFAPDIENCARRDSGAAVGFGGGMFLVVWSNWYELCAVRMMPDGSVLDAKPLVLTKSIDSKHGPVLTFDGSNFLLTWAHALTPSTVGQPPPGDVLGLRVRPSDGAVLDAKPIAIAAATNTQGAQSAVFDGTNHFVVWHDRRGTGEVKGGRVRPDGTLLDPDGFTVHPAQQAHVTPSVAFDGTNLLVVWQEGPFVRARRMRPDGSAIDATSFDIDQVSGGSTEFLSPKVKWDGSAYVVFWGSVGANSQRQVSSARVPALSGPAGAPRPLVAFTNRPYQFGSWAVAADGGKHLVMWSDASSQEREYLGSGAALMGSAFDPVTGATRGAPFILNRTGREQHNPHAAFDGRHHLFVFNEWNGSRLRIRGTRVRDLDGAVLDGGGFAISQGTGADDIFPLTASNGRNHLVLWQRGAELQAVRVRGDDGVVLDSAPLTFSAKQQVGQEIGRPAFTVASNGSDYLVVWVEGNAYFGNATTVKMVRISGDDGRVLAGPSDLALPARVAAPALGRLGGQYLLVWAEHLEGKGRVWARRLDDAGAPVGGAFALDEPGSASLVETKIAVAPQGTLVSWVDNGSFKSRMVSAEGAALGDVVTSTGTTDSNQNRHGTATAFDGEHFVALRMVYSYFVNDVALSRFSTAGALLDPQPVMLASEPWWENDVALSAGTGGRLVAGYIRSDPDAPYGTWRLHLRTLGYPATPPVVVDAGAPPVVVDAGAPPVVVDAGAPPVVDAGPSLDASPAPAPDGGSTDASVDAGAAPDVISSEGGVEAGGGDARLDGGGDMRADGSVDGRPDAGADDDEPACTCRVGGTGGKPPAMMVLLVGLGLVVALRRSRTRSPSHRG